MSEMLHMFVPSIGALAAVLGLVVLAGRVLQRSGLVQRASKGTARRLVIQDTLALDRTRRLMVIRVDDRDLLVVSGGANAESVVGWLPEPGFRS